MNTAHHVDLGNRFIKTITHFLLDILNTHLIGLLMTLFLTKGTEFTQVGADV